MAQVDNTDYQQWLGSLKQAFRQRQLKAAVAVNTQLLEFYWHLGKEIIQRQQQSQWGDAFLDKLSRDLSNEFPDVKGFSLRNLKYIRQWVSFWNQEDVIGQQAVAQLMHIPWGHNLLLISKCRSIEEAIFYVAKTQQHGWSRAVLTHQMESQLWQRKGRAVDGELKTEQDQPTIGLLLCRSRNKLIAEYALKGIETPMGISEYQLTQSLPADLQDKLPSIELIERELARELNQG